MSDHCYSWLSGSDTCFTTSSKKGHGATLCGRDWLTQLRLNWEEIKQVNEPKGRSLEELLKKYPQVFYEELGTLKDIKATIVVKADLLPKFCKHRPLPFAMKERVEIELKRLEEVPIISPVSHSSWAATVVPVERRDKSLCLYGTRCQYIGHLKPLPWLEELLATLGGGRFFSKIYLASSYQQVLLDEDLKKYMTINNRRVES